MARTAIHIGRATLEWCLEALHHFDCPSHHRPYYLRTEETLHYLLRPEILDRVVFVQQPTLAPLSADLVPDSGVCFLRRTTRGPTDMASALERGALDGPGLFLRLWDDALGIEYEPWQELADRAPAIFVRLGESVQNAEGRWHWAPMQGKYQEFAFPDVGAAFQSLIDEAAAAGKTERAQRLHHWRYGILE